MKQTVTKTLRTNKLINSWYLERFEVADCQNSQIPFCVKVSNLGALLSNCEFSLLTDETFSKCNNNLQMNKKQSDLG